MAFAERITAHKTLLNSGDLSGVFLFLLVVNMRLGRMVTAALLGTAFAEYLCSSGSDWDSFLWGGAQQSKSKPNRVSQAKRRKYKRQGR